MPGLIDAHWHSIFAALSISALVSADVGYIFLATSSDAERTLLRGFTTVRDLGGPSFALK
jgi:imidazolonepropionase-like amidohydrolase